MGSSSDWGWSTDGESIRSLMAQNFIVPCVPYTVSPFKFGGFLM